MNYKLTDIIAPSFYKLHHDIKNCKYTDYILRGGRGSTKSSFISVEIILGMMSDASKGIHSNAVIFRQVKSELNTSVKAQIEWAINALGVRDKWEVPEAKLAVTYKPTGQKILFRGMDKAKKTKGVKASKGWFKYIWFEELDEFRGMEDIRTATQSVMRGGDKFFKFYSYNPPKSGRSWVNKEALIRKKGRVVHNSDYTTVPKRWLGEEFITEAEHLKKINLNAYKHEYLGLEVGTGLEVFNNITNRKITDEEVRLFDNYRQGLDFGYAKDPVAFIRMHFDKTRKRLYLLSEFGGINISNKKLFESVQMYKHIFTTCDSAEPKSIAELKCYGMRVKGAKKVPDSIDYGMKYMAETIEEIIIDHDRTPKAFKEFNDYCLEVDGNGDVKGGYPDKNNHIIDGARYALENDMRNARRGLQGQMIGI